MAFHIVLTGGPSSGKTTMSKELREVYSPNVTICAEAAEMLFRGGYPRIDTSFGLEQRQYAIFHLQKSLENIALNNPQNSEIIIFDRGLLDGLCYWPGSFESFAKTMHIDISKTYQRYDLIIQLGVAHDEDYLNTAFRTESAETGLAMEKKLKEIWTGHPNYHFIPYNSDWEHKRQKTLELIQALKA